MDLSNRPEYTSCTLYSLEANYRLQGRPKLWGVMHPKNLNFCGVRTPVTPTEVAPLHTQTQTDATERITSRTAGCNDN